VPDFSNHRCKIAPNCRSLKREQARQFVKRPSCLKDSIALLGAGVVTAALVVFALELWIYFSLQPPKESTTIANFYSHRAQHEQLRDMLLSDKSFETVASWGVRTPESIKPKVPPEGGVSLDRFHRYLALLGEIGGYAAFRTEGKHPQVGVVVWAAGWAGNTRHASICWREDSPPRQAVSLDDFYRTTEPGEPVYRHIEGNWWIRAD
jgi:hypothetical protein